ncbi:Urea active transporter [Fulvia fulva]|uniref:Urea active transporter n=1 Tax=Passalora fulva TaxID=5499 RepID=A0A9Q8P951_PASFU|nr:Urea active transporter [Fulvia fulva]KAK4625992.1 Urea active transporter [Fulvia fulva]UJO17909.1 Urea active transporter [Fulvia fulva]
MNWISPRSYRPACSSKDLCHNAKSKRSAAVNFVTSHRRRRRHFISLSPTFDQSFARQGVSESMIQLAYLAGRFLSLIHPLSPPTNNHLSSLSSSSRKSYIRRNQLIIDHAEQIAPSSIGIARCGYMPLPATAARYSVFWHTLLRPCTSWQAKMAENDAMKVLPAGAGYAIVIGIGGVFAAIMRAITCLQNRYTGFSSKQAEEFNTASRSVKPGLIASGIVSSCTWSATLLTSSTFAYSYGVCGPMWYGAMGTLQILLFALIAIKIKANAPGAHTFPEILLAKHGKVAHLTYLFFGLCTNMLVGACLVLGGSQVVSALTGMNVYSSCFLIPLVVAACVVAGGLRSTFIADYIHTAVLFVAIFVFSFCLYATSDLVGSPSRLYDLLLDASENMPIAKNAGNGSYLAFRSVDGLVFAIDLFAAGFSTVWLDQAYWQRAIASRPESSVKAYLLGGVAWYGIPFGFATAMGLGCAALTRNPRFPTYPDALSAAQNNAGLSSAGHSDHSAWTWWRGTDVDTALHGSDINSLLTFDVYKTYVEPDAPSSKLVKISHYGIMTYALVLAAFCCILNAVGINLTWLLTVLAIIVGGGAVPVGLVLIWKRTSTAAAIASPWIGLACGLIAWFITAWKRSGEISITSTGDTTNAVAGNITSFGVGWVTYVILTLLSPAKYTSTDARHIERSNKIQGIMNPTSFPATLSGSATTQISEVASEKKQLPGPAAAEEPATLALTGNDLVDFLETSHIEPMDPEAVKSSERIAIGANVIFISIAVILVPFMLFGTGYVYSRAFFEGWVVVSFLWVWVSMIICVIYPVFESTGALKGVSLGLWRDCMALFGTKRSPAAQSAGDA